MLILALFITLAPFVVVWFTKKVHLSFSLSIATSLMMVTGVALLLQVAGLFTKPLYVFVLIVLIAGLALYVYRRKKRTVHTTRIQWTVVMLVIASLSIVFYQLYAVHFAYTGSVNTLRGETYVSGSSYAYPLFSDEWIAVAVAQESIERQGLPFTHPFSGRAYQNFLFVFHSFVAGIGMLFGGALPVVYVWLGIVINTAIVAVSYMLWRSWGISVGVSSVGVLLMPYMTNGSNLPMLWYLLPWNVGFLLLLIALVALAHKQIKIALLVSLLSVAFYPPLIALLLPSILVAAWVMNRQTFMKILSGVGIFCISAPILFTVLLSVTTNLSFMQSLTRFWNIMVRPLHSVLGTVPTFLPWYVLPVAVVTIPAALYGLYRTWRQQYVVGTMIVIGLVIWILNPLVNTTFFIDYHRVVAITSLLLFVMSIFGIHHVWVLVAKRVPPSAHQAISSISIGVLLIIFVLLMPGYTARDAWRNFTTPYYSSAFGFQKEAPAAPVNRYITADDLSIFSMITNERFLAPGWKGLILGTLTSNEPVFTKPATITVSQVRYVTFLQASCEEKTTMLAQANVSYVYAEKINCAGFVSIATSGEGLHLMRVVHL